MTLTELANKGGLFGVGSPFSVCDAAILVDVQTKDLGTLQSYVSVALTASTITGTKRKLMTDLAELLQTTFCLVDGIDPRLGFGIAPLESVLERLEPGVNAQDTCIFCISF